MKASALGKGAAALSEMFAAEGIKLYLVGGTVRNIALGLPRGDFDVCSAALPEQAAAFLRRAGAAVIEKAPQMGTIEVHLMMDGIRYVFEHTTFRRDFYPAGGAHRPERVAFTKDIALDAKRRDFTMNALYIEIGSGDIIDPTGRGLKDIRRKRISAAADDPADTIGDDGLRIMRLARFAAELGFEADPMLLDCAAQNAVLLRDVSAERKRDELKKILMADTAYDIEKTSGEPAHQRGLQLLRDIGALKHILPRLWEGDGVAQSEKYHRHDVLGHGIRTCGAAPPDLVLRLAALLHDIGKPRALEQDGSMHGHERIGGQLVCRELTDLRFEKAICHDAAQLAANHMFDLEGRAKPKTIRKRAVKLGRAAFERLIELRRADFLGSGRQQGAVRSAERWQAELERMAALGVPWSRKDLHISGSEIAQALGIEPSPKIGRILDRLFWECVAQPGRNDREMLLRRAKRIASTL